MLITTAAAAAAASSPALHTQVAVIGGGVIGLAVSRALALRGKEVLLIERNSSMCQETSSRNSEVIHAGLYYPPGSTKAILCSRGNKLLYDYCKEKHIPHSQCGKLIVANGPSQVEKELRQLLEQAQSNGVDGMRLLSKEDVKQLEPEVSCHGALWSASTGVVDSHTFFMNLWGDFESASGTTVLNTSVKKGEYAPTTHSRRTSELRLQMDDDENSWISCDQVVNCAGLWAADLAAKFHPASGAGSGKHVPTSSLRHYFAKGTYFKLTGRRRAPFSHLIYPVPEPGGLGVHATIDWTGDSVKFGPDVEWLDYNTTCLADISYEPQAERGCSFYDQVRRYWPALEDGSLQPDYVGIRPKLNHPDFGPISFEDFRILGPETHHIPGLVHLLGIESPGLTSSLAMGEYVSDLLERSS